MLSAHFTHMQNESAASANIKNNSFGGNQKLKAIKNLIFIELHEKNFIKKFQIELLSKNTWFYGAKKSYNYILYFHMATCCGTKVNAKESFVLISLLLLSDDSVNFVNFKFAFIVISIQGSHITWDACKSPFTGSEYHIRDENKHAIVPKCLYFTLFSTSLFANSFNSPAICNQDVSYCS